MKQETGAAGKKYSFHLEKRHISVSFNLLLYCQFIHSTNVMHTHTSDMHYGQGMMKEEIERARRRAEAASPRKNGYSYHSPLGAGFSFDKEKPISEQMNPYSRRGKQQHDKIDQNGGFRIEYEEAYFDMNGSDLADAKRVMRGKEHIVERMKDRRKHRVRERGDPNPWQADRRADLANLAGKYGQLGGFLA